jgi:DNA-binding transcriptional regulator YdaS (Cro superfamily)
MKPGKRISCGLALAIEAAGGSKYALAKRLGIKAQSINDWAQVPINRVVQIERVTGISRQKLRPDLYAP